MPTPPSFVASVTPSGAGGASTGAHTFVASSTALPAPVITSAATATGTVGVSFTYQITATNSPTEFGAQGLAPGLYVNPSNGEVIGSPTATGTSTFTVYAMNDAGTGEHTVTLTVTSASPGVPAPGQVLAGVAYTDSLGQAQIGTLQPSGGSGLTEAQAAQLTAVATAIAAASQILLANDYVATPAPAVVIPAQADPTLCTGYLTTYDAQGAILAHAGVQFKLVSVPNASGGSYETVFSASSDANGLLAVALIQGAMYLANRQGSMVGRQVRVLVPTGVTDFALPTILSSC